MNRLESFNQHRPLLFSIAYRMLGSVTEAEDILQETFIRWQQTSEVNVRSPKAFLAQIVTRLCIDYLRSARIKREKYIGAWLPEPIVTQNTADPSEMVEMAESLSTAFLVMLESLSPTERAVFLLREIFDYDYDEIGRIVGKSVANCRQILRRSRQHLAARKSYLPIAPQQQEQLTGQFLQAWTQGDLQSLLALLTEDTTLWSDGGGKVTAAIKPLHGYQKVARFLLAIRRSKKTLELSSELAQINCRTGIINYVDRRLHSVMTFEASGDRIHSIYIVINPDKLKWVDIVLINLSGDRS